MSRRIHEKPIEPVFEKQVHTVHLVKVSRVIRQSLREHHPEIPPDAVLESTIRGQCAECGHPLRGKDLVTLARGEPIPDAFSNLGRLQAGYCGSNQCRSYYYAISFFAYPDVDWNKVVPSLDDIMNGVVIGSTDSRPRWMPVITWRPTPKTWVIAGGIGVALCILAGLRQIYVGGRIPVLHEPRHFRVAPFPRDNVFR